MIPARLLLPGDTVKVLDKQTGTVTIMAATDAKHAVMVEPERYEFFDPVSDVAAVEIASEPEPSATPFEPEQPETEPAVAAGQSSKRKKK